MNRHKKKLSPKQSKELLGILKVRFAQNKDQHTGLANRLEDLQWSEIQARLEAHPEKQWSLHAMESTGGKPDVVAHDKKTGEYLFMIVRQKALKDAGVFVMTVKRWNPGKRTSRKTALWIWLPLWTSNC